MPLPPLASAEDPPPSPEAQKSESVPHSDSGEEAEASMSWTDIKDAWTESPSARQTSAGASSSEGEDQFDLVEKQEEAQERLTGQDSAVAPPIASADSRATATASYEASAPSSIWSRRSSSVSSEQDARSTASTESQQGDEASQTGNMRLSFPDPIASSVPSLGAELSGDARRNGSEADSSDGIAIEAEDVPPSGLDGEYSLLLDVTEPPTDSTAASSGSIETSSDASERSSVPASPSSDASRQLAVADSPFDSPEKMVPSGAAYQPVAAARELLLSTGPFQDKVQAAQSDSTPRRIEPDSPSPKQRTRAVCLVKDRVPEQPDAWNLETEVAHSATYDPANVHAWVRSTSSSSFGSFDVVSTSASKTVRVGVTGSETEGSTGSGVESVDPADSRLKDKVEMSSAELTSPPSQSMTSSAATVVPGGRAEQPIVAPVGDEMPGAFGDTPTSDPGISEEAAPVADNTPRIPTSPRSRRTLMVLSVVTAAVAIASAAWRQHPSTGISAERPSPIPTGLSTLAAVNADGPAEATFSATLKALIEQTAGDAEARTALMTTLSARIRSDAAARAAEFDQHADAAAASEYDVAVVADVLKAEAEKRTAPCGVRSRRSDLVTRTPQTLAPASADVAGVIAETRARLGLDPESSFRSRGEKPPHSCRRSRRESVSLFVDAPQVIALPPRIDSALAPITSEANGPNPVVEDSTQQVQALGTYAESTTQWDEGVFPDDAGLYHSRRFIQKAARGRRKAVRHLARGWDNLRAVWQSQKRDFREFESNCRRDPQRPGCRLPGERFVRDGRLQRWLTLADQHVRSYEMPAGALVRAANGGRREVLKRARRSIQEAYATSEPTLGRALSKVRDGARSSPRWLDVVSKRVRSSGAPGDLVSATSRGGRRALKRARRSLRDAYISSQSAYARALAGRRDRDQARFSPRKSFRNAVAHLQPFLARNVARLGTTGRLGTSAANEPGTTTVKHARKAAKALRRTEKQRLRGEKADSKGSRKKARRA